MGGEGVPIQFLQKQGHFYLEVCNNGEDYILYNLNIKKKSLDVQVKMVGGGSFPKFFPALQGPRGAGSTAVVARGRGAPGHSLRVPSHLPLFPLCPGFLI